MDPILIISILVFLALSLSIFGVNRLRWEQKEGLTKRLDKVVSSPDEEAEGKPGMPSLEINKLFSSVGKGFTGLSFTKKIEIQLDKADVLLRVEEFIGMNICTAIGGGLLLLLLTNNTIYALLGLLLGASLPGLFVYRQKLKRAEMLSEEIGESLTGMSNSLRAGYSFQQAMDLIAKETQGPLGKEYRRTLREVNLGVTTDQALQNLVKRVNNEDMELMISTVLIQRSIGGNLAEIFDKIADTIRQRIRMKGEIQVLTAQGRISSWIIGAMPIVLLIAISVLSPDYVSMFFETPLGWGLLAFAAVSEVIGFILIKKVTNIEF